MKKLISLALSLGLIYLALPASFIQANNINDTDVSSQQDKKEFNVGIEGVTPENGVYLIENPDFKFELSFPEKVDINQLEVGLEPINGSCITLPYNHPIISNEQVTNHAFVEGQITNEGSTTVKVSIKNIENSTILYSDVLFLKVDFGELFVSENEFNLSTDQLAVSHILGNPDVQDVEKKFVVGFKKKDGTIIDYKDLDLEVGIIHVNNSNPLIATYGDYIVHWDDERLLPILSKWEHYEEFVPFYWQKAKESNSKYTTFNEFSDIIQEFQKLHGYEGNGIGIAGPDVLNGIIARNPGTSYITLSTSTDNVKIKVNVSNLSEQPIDTIPNNFAGEYYSDANTSVNVNLSQPNVVSKDIFAASKETAKNSTFNILNTDGKVNYSWTFEGNKINRTDLDVNLLIAKNDKYVSDIKAKTKLNDLLVLNFAHNGELPAPAKVKVYIGDTFKNGEQLYLNHWDSNKKSSSEVANSLTVKDGYVEFTINHSSTYFLTKEKVSNKNPNDDNGNNNNQGTNVDKPTHDNKTDTPQTGTNENTSLYLILSITSLMLIGCLVIKKRLAK